MNQWVPCEFEKKTAAECLPINGWYVNSLDHLKRGSSRKYTPNMSPEHSTEYWNEKAQAILKQNLVEVQSPITDNAKNIIMFLDNGMSVHVFLFHRSGLPTIQETGMK